MTKRSYDSGGRLASLTYPSGAAVVRSYDPAGRVGSLKSGTTTLAGGIGYLPFGPTTGWAQGNGASYGRTYDKDERIAVIGLGSSGNMVLTHDAASQIVKIDETDVNPKLFVHDPAGQLTTYSDLANPITPFLGYSYDPDGNRITLNENKGASVITSILPAISNLLGGTSGAATRTLSYDKDGSTTLDHRVVTVLGYTFDAGERLVKAKTGAFTTTYLNDGLGRRVSRAGYGAQGIAGGKQEFVHDLEGHLLGEYDGNGKAIEETVWLLDRGSNPGQAPGSGAGQDLPVAVLIPGQTPDYVAADQLGAPHQIADSSRNLVWRWDHDPFGNGAPTGTLIYNPRFPGQYFDKETGFNYNGRRDYDPTTGRYVESDPIGLKGGINTYGYAGNNPVDLSDALGLSPGARFEEQSYCFDIECVESNGDPFSSQQAIEVITEEPTGQSPPDTHQLPDAIFDPTRPATPIIYDPLTLAGGPLAGQCRSQIPANKNFDSEEAALLQSALKSATLSLSNIYQYESEKSKRKRAEEAAQTEQSSTPSSTWSQSANRM